MTAQAPALRGIVNSERDTAALRVLHIYSGGAYGGIERLLVTLARLRGLSPAIDPAFLLYPAGSFNRELENAGATVHRLGVEGVRLRHPVGLWRARRKLRGLLKAQRIDVLVPHNLWMWVMFAPAGRAAGLPCALWLHENPGERSLLARWARLTPPDLLVWNSHFTAGLASNLFAGVHAEIIYCPVEPVAPSQLCDRRQLRARHEAAGDTTVIVQASRLSRYKGHELFLEALGKLRDLPAWVCWQLGGAQSQDQVEYLEHLKRQALELGIADRVHFLGYHGDVSPFLRAADIHCQPNAGPEPFGIAFVEALYAGLPVVTTAMGGALEIVNEQCGILTPPGDADALAVALAELIRNRELRVRLGANGPARARQLCDPARQMTKLAAILKQAASCVPGQSASGGVATP